MERVHDAIEWYQKKIGSYDKQLWEQSVEKKLQKQPEFVRQNAPRRKVRPKTEYIDVDLIRGSTFTKTKPQVPWVYVTKKALARVLFFPFYYSWWVHQTSGWAYVCLLCLYVLQVTSICVYVCAGDGLLEDELSFTEVVLPMILMFLLCLIHSQTVLAHITHKPPKHKPISGVTRKIKPKVKKSAQKVNNLGSKSSYPDAGNQTNSVGHSTQPNDVFTTAYPAQSSHASLPFDRKQNCQQPSLRLSTASDCKMETMSQEAMISSHSFHQVEQDSCLNQSVQGLPCSSATLVQPSSSLSSFSSTLVTKSHSNSAGREVSGPNKKKEEKSLYSSGTAHTISNSDNSSFLHYSPACQSMSKICKEQVKEMGVQKQHDSSKSETIPSSAPSSCGCSLNSSVLGNLPIMRLSCGQQDFIEADFDDRERSGSMTESSMSGISEELDSETKGVDGQDSEEIRNICISKSQLNIDSKALTNGDPAGGKLQSIPEDQRGVDSDTSSINGKVHQAVNAKNAINQERSKLSPHSSHKLSCIETAQEASKLSYEEPWSEANNEKVDPPYVLERTPSSQKSIENGHLSHVQSSSHHKPFYLKDHNLQDHEAEVKLVNVVEQTSPQMTSPKISSTDSKLKHLVGFEKITKETQSMSSKVFSSPAKTNGEATPQSISPEHCIYQPIVNTSNEMTNKSVCSAQRQPISDCEGIQRFSEYLVDKILNRETLRLKSSSSEENIPDSKAHLQATGSVDQTREVNGTKGRKDHSNFYPSLSPASSSTSLPSPKFENKDNRPNLLNMKAEPCFDSAISSLSTHTSHTVTDLPKQTCQDDPSCLRRLHELQSVKDAPDESNVSDEDDDGNAGKELDVDADDDDDGEDDGTDSDLEMDKSARLKQLRFQDNLSDGKEHGMQQQPQLRRRRRVCGATISVTRDGTCPVACTEGDSSGVHRDDSRIKMVPNSLGLRLPHDTVLKGHRGDKHVSSSENECVGGQTPEGSHKAAVSSEEWEDRIQTDETTSSAYSSTCGDSEEEAEKGRVRSQHSFEDDGEERTEYTTSTLHVINLLQPGGSPSNSGGNVTQSDRVSCLIWEGSECKKVDLTALDIGWAIIDKVDSLPESSDYFLIGLLFSAIIGLIPLVFRAWMNRESLPWDDIVTLSGLLYKLQEVPSLIAAVYTWRQWLLLINSVLQRFCLSLIFFFLLSVADRTFKQRLLYAKHFSYLTSSRRARKFSMPHFRLSKVRNIKIWLSLRSYLKRRGPQRSVDVIVSACFMSAICTVSLISLQMLKDSDNYLGYLCNWELLVWCCGLAIFLMRFMTVGLKINKKYRNLSVLITEQINLYLQMEQKPHKKEELILANNVLRLAEDLLKELESPFKISGFSANPVVYNIMRVVVLSAFSAVLTEVLGFKLKLYKIKLKG